MFCKAFFKASTLLILLKFSHQQAEDDCGTIRNCHQCLYTPSCSWYIDYSSTNGSGCFSNDYLEQVEENTKFGQGYKHPPKTRYYVTKVKKKYAISPREASLNIRLNEPFSFPIIFTPRHENWGNRTVEMKYSLGKSETVKISFSSNCNGSHPKIMETNKCENVKYGSSVQFFVKVEALKCSKHQPQHIQKIDINPFPSSATLRLHLYPYCYCPCELDDSVRANPHPSKIIPDCKNRGNFKCGVCYCRDGYAGRNCEINTSNTVDE